MATANEEGESTSEETEEDKKFQDEQVRDYYDDQERKQFHDYKVGMRRSPLSNNILNLLSRLLQPQTTGFSQINMDMAFTYLDSFGVYFVKNSSFLITFCKLYGFKKSEYIERSSLATHLVANRSLHGKSMELFTTTVTKQSQEYSDKTQKKVGFFAGLGIGDKKDK